MLTLIAQEKASYINLQNLIPTTTTTKTTPTPIKKGLFKKLPQL